MQQHLQSLSGHLLADQLLLPSKFQKQKSASAEHLSRIAEESSRPKSKRSLSGDGKSVNIDLDFVNSDESDVSQFTSDRTEYEEENPTENWKGKIKGTKLSTPRNRRKQLSILAKHDPEYFRNNIRMLKNGFAKQKLTTIHTCPFHLIYAIFGVACLEYESILENYLNSDSELSDFLKEIIKGPKADVAECYRMRNGILNTIFSSKYYRKCGNIKINTKALKFIDCDTGIGSFFWQLVGIGDNFASFKLTLNCRSCDVINKSPRPLIPLLTQHGSHIQLQNIEEYT